MNTAPIRPDGELTDDQVADIRASGQSVQWLAETHSISVDHVRRIIRGLSRTQATTPPRLPRSVRDDSSGERWAVIEAYPAYEVSTLGRVRRSARGVGALAGRILRASHVSSGHFMVTLYLDGKRHAVFIHDLVLEAFVGPCLPGMQARHGPGGEDDDRLSNLHWGLSPLASDPDLVGMADIAQRVGTSRQVVVDWRVKGLMPPPRYNGWRCVRWSWALDIEPWLRVTHRLGEFDNQPGERWTTIQGYPWYEVSTLGRVRRVAAGQGARAGRPLKPRPVKGDYLMVAIYGDNRKRYDAYVHRLVLEAFVGPCPEGMETCHKNSNPADNSLENLRWGTHESNTQDKINARLARGCDCGRPLQWGTNGEGKRFLRCVHCYRAKKRARYYAGKKRLLNG